MTPEDTVMDAIDFPPKSANTSVEARAHVRKVVRSIVDDTRRAALEEAAEWVRNNHVVDLHGENKVMKLVNGDKVKQEQSALADAMLKALGGKQGMTGPEVKEKYFPNVSLDDLENGNSAYGKDVFKP
jgi:hypothetical protein